MRIPRMPAAVAVTVLALHSALRAGPPDEKTPADAVQAAREAAWGRVETRLAEAEKKVRAATLEHAADVGEFFTAAKGKTRGLADELLSLEGKWEYLTRSGEGYREYLRERYEGQVMKPATLLEALERATKSFLKELDAIENELLVAVEADLADADLPRGTFPALTGARPFAKHFHETAERFDTRMRKNLRETAGREVASFVVGEAATHVAVRVATAAAARLGVSSAILGGSVGVSVATLGAGFAVCIAVDYLLDIVLEELGYDPAKEISQKMNDGLDQLSDSLIMPSAEQRKVVAALRRMIEESPEPEVKLAGWQAHRRIVGSGAAGLIFTLNGVGNERSLVWRSTLERLIRGSSVTADRLVTLEKEWAPLAGLGEEQAERKAAELLNWDGAPGVEAVLARLKGRPEDRVRAAQAAVLLFGGRGERATDDGVRVRPTAGTAGGEK